MTAPYPSYRVVAGLRVPYPLVPRLIEAICARYPDATEGITDPDAAVRAALRAWAAETLIEHETMKAEEPVSAAIARTITEYEARAAAARTAATTAATLIVEDVEPLADPLPDLGTSD